MSDAPRRGTIFGKNISDKWMVFAGDCEGVNEYLHEKSSPPVLLLLKYVNSLLRSFGYVIFANNPVSGLIILLAILSADHLAGLTAILCSTLSFILAVFLKQDTLGNLNGFFGYNAVLLGTYSAGLPQLYSAVSVDEPKFWLFLILIALISVYVTSALANLFRYLGQHPIPCFLLPFNILQYILIFCLINNSFPAVVLPVKNNSSLGFPAVTERAPETTTELGRRMKSQEAEEYLYQPTDSDGFDAAFNNETHWNWGRVFSGTIVSVSQIYGLNNVPASVFMLLSLMIYSPTTTFFCYVGSVLGTLFGVTFANDATDIYNGLWGYNGLLCGGALAGFGFVLTVHSVVLSLTAILFSTVLQHYLSPLFLSYGVPIFTLPFNITAILFLFVTSDSEKALPRPSNLSFPEKHRHDYKQQLKGEMEGYLRRPRATEEYTKHDV